MQKEKILITVKTYPTLSQKYGELVCTAGIRENGTWVRIYPIPFRRLKEYYRFKKYTWIELPLEKNKNDVRPESYRPIDLSQINCIGSVDTKGQWQDRRYLLLNNQPCYNDMSDLIARAKTNALSLALFKPTAVDDFVWEPTEQQWNKKKLNAVLAELKQGFLFSQEEFVEDFRIVKKLPYVFSYVFRDVNGKKSKLMIEDWEVGALYWNCVKKCASEEEALTKVKEKFFETFVKKRELFFYLGTTQQWHFVGSNPFVIVGTFAPPKRTQTCLDF